MKLLIYIEVLLLTAIWILLQTIFTPIISFIVKTGAMASFYSRHGLHFWQTKKATEALVKDLEEQLKKFESK